MIISRGVQNDAFAHIDAIKIESEGFVVKSENIVSEYYNLNTVKEVLRNAIELIETEIEKMSSKKT
jgi:hypothetical protein